MTAQLQAVEAFRAFAEKTTGQPASVGLLPTGESIAMQVVTGSREFTSLDLANRRAVLSLDVLSKYKKQEQAYGCLCEIANACDTAGLGAPAVNAEVRSEPLFVGMDGEYWIYSLSVALRVII
mgnify:CR=1 FL=1